MVQAHDDCVHAWCVWLPWISRSVYAIKQQTLVVCSQTWLLVGTLSRKIYYCRFTINHFQKNHLIIKNTCKHNRQNLLAVLVGVVQPIMVCGREERVAVRQMGQALVDVATDGVLHNGSLMEINKFMLKRLQTILSFFFFLAHRSV